MTQRTNAMNILGAFPLQAVSQITVDVASMAENEELIPSKKRVNPRMKAQKLDPAMVLIAVGYETKASPTPAICFESSWSIDLRYPTTDHTANPAIKLKLQLVTEMIMKPKITRFLKAAREKGCDTQEGYEALKGQAQANMAFFGLQ